jgi:predicted DNA-binding transcriptional regulator AlpA
MKPHHSNADNEMSGRPARVARARHDSDWLRVTVRPAEATPTKRTTAASRASDSGAGGGTGHRTLSALLQTPTRAAEIPLEQVPALVAELASEQAALSAFQGVLTARLLLTPADRTSDGTGDRLLTSDEVAKMLGVTKRWVQRRARRLPFSRRISVRSVRYSEAGLKRWMAHRQAPKL